MKRLIHDAAWALASRIVSRPDKVEGHREVYELIVSGMKGLLAAIEHERQRLEPINARPHD